ncbi:hypothetical protein ACR80S_10375 [Halomonas sp. MA07-2]|uniref:hypothetical protein n=1 Tax=unclassified Halomonas TaxID=2609666 RepID=UPI003EEDA23F
MTTSLGLIVMVSLSAVVGVALLRGHGKKRPASWQRLVASVLAGIVILFLVWMAIMVLVVGPGMRTT